MGRLATGTNCLAAVWVRGRSLVPLPPARTRAFTISAFYPLYLPAVNNACGSAPSRYPASSPVWGCLNHKLIGEHGFPKTHQGVMGFVERSKHSLFCYRKNCLDRQGSGNNFNDTA